MNQVKLNETSSEIERKWLVKYLPDISKLDYKVGKIRQGYIVSSADSNEVRLRSKVSDDHFEYYLTVKSDGTLERSEYEINLSKDQFDKLWPATKDRRLEKTRYTFTVSNYQVELDVFDGELEGLHLVEVEFDSEKDSESFMEPDWFGQDVTHDKKYKNKNLCS